MHLRTIRSSFLFARSCSKRNAVAHCVEPSRSEHECRRATRGLATAAGLTSFLGVRRSSSQTSAVLPLEPLGEAARATAKRLGLGRAETETLVRRYHDLTRELSGPGAKPLPPLLYGIAKGSRDHTLSRYQNVVLPALAELRPAPRARVVLFQSGVHGYEKPEPDLPRGILPSAMTLWEEAIQQGYYLQ